MKKEITLRPYQEDAIERALWSINKFDNNSLIVAPTGSGKSLIIGGIADNLRKEVLILQPSKEILEQNVEKLKLYVPEDEIGIYSASAKRKDINKYTFATIQSIYKKPELFKHIGLVLVDECHQVNPKNAKGMFSSFLNKINNPVTIGLTATPFRNIPYTFRTESGFYVSKLSLRLINRVNPRVWNRISYNINNHELVEQGYLTKLKYFDRSEIEHKRIPLNKSGTDYDLMKYMKMFQPLETQIIDSIIKAQNHRKAILVFCASLEQAERFSNAVEGSRWVSGETPIKEREEIINGFKDGSIKVVFNMGVLCLDSKTEILTQRGFVNKDEFDLDTDEVANWDDGKIWFSKAKGYVHRPLEIKENFITVNTKHASLRVTGNHRMLYKKYSGGKFNITDANSLHNTSGFLPVSGASTPIMYKVVESTLPKSSYNRRLVANSYHLRKKGMSKNEAREEAKKRLDQIIKLEVLTPDKLSLDWCKLIGFWTGDGTKAGARFSLSQSKVYPNIINFIDNILDNTGIHFIKRDKIDHYKWELPTGRGFGEQNVAGLFPINPYLNKNGSEYLWGLDEKQFDAFVLGFWYADGDHGRADKIPSSFRISNINKTLLELLQCIAVCRGYRASINACKIRNENHKQLWRLTLRKENQYQFTKNTVLKEEYIKDEFVWCVTSESGNLITRRNGKVVIMGNTTGFDFPELDTIYLLRPTKSLGLYYQMLGRGVRTALDKEDCYVLDYSGSYRELGRIEDIKYVNENGYWEVYAKDERMHGKVIYEREL